MTRPKRWFLVQDTDSAVVIKNTDGLIKKPNAARPLGKVVEVSGDTRLECVCKYLHHIFYFTLCLVYPTMIGDHVFI